MKLPRLQAPAHVGRRCSDAAIVGCRDSKRSNSLEIDSKVSLLALNALKLDGSIKGKLRRAGWNDDFLARLLCQPPQTKVKCDSRVNQ